MPTDTRRTTPSFGQQVLKKLVDREVETRFQQKMEAEAAGVSPQQTLKTLLEIYDPQTGASGTLDPSSLAGTRNITLAAPGTPPTVSSGEGTAAAPSRGATPGLNQALAGRTPSRLEQFLGLDMSKGLIQQGEIDPTTGESTAASALFGLIRESASNQLARSQAALNEQELRGEKKFQVSDIQKTVLEGLIKADSEGLLKPNDLFQGFSKASAPFITVRDAHTRVEESAKDPSAAGDLALIFNFMKVLDPGSTVREGEFATAQNSAGVPTRFVALYNRVLNGQRLANSQRSDILDRSRRLFKGAERQQAQTVQQFTKLAKRNQIDPDVFMTDVGIAGGQRQQPTRLTAQDAKTRGAVAFDTERQVFLDANGQPVQ